jgi:hypothetical protein
MNSLKRQSRIATLLYFLNTLPAPFGLIYVPNVLIARGDAIATAINVRNLETLLRLGIAVELWSATVGIFAMVAFYRLFRTVSQKNAMAMIILFLVATPISYLNVLNDLAAITFARGPEFLSAVFDQRQLDAFVLFFLRLHNQGLILAQIFWGLWLFPFGVVLWQSGFIPRVIGVFAIIAGFGNVIASAAFLFLPTYAGVIGQYATILQAGELAFIWMLIWGAKEKAQAQADPLPVGI